MAIVYRRDLTRNLSAEEGDGNIDDIVGRLTTLEAGAPSPAEIDNIELLGDQLTFSLTDYSSYSVTLPDTGWKDRGYFAAVSYLVHDVFIARGNLYKVKFAHTATLPFDPGANDGLGHDYYEIALRNFGIPYTVGDATTSITVTSAMENQYIRCLSSSPVTISLSEADLLLMSDEFEVQFRQCTTLGTLTLDIEGTITINRREFRLDSTNVQGAVILIKRVGTLEVDLIGDFAISDS